MESSTNSILETTGITSSTNSIHETTEVTLTEADITTYFDIVTVSTILPEITTKDIDNPEDDGPNIGAIVGGLIAAIVLITLVVLLIIVAIIKRHCLQDMLQCKTCKNNEKYAGTISNDLEPVTFDLEASGGDQMIGNPVSNKLHDPPATAADDRYITKASPTPDTSNSEDELYDTPNREYGAYDHPKSANEIHGRRPKSKKSNVQFQHGRPKIGNDMYDYPKSNVQHQHACPNIGNDMYDYPKSNVQLQHGRPKIGNDMYDHPKSNVQLQHGRPNIVNDMYDYPKTNVQLQHGCPNIGNNMYDHPKSNFQFQNNYDLNDDGDEIYDHPNVINAMAVQYQIDKGDVYANHVTINDIEMSRCDINYDQSNAGSEMSENLRSSNDIYDYTTAGEGLDLNLNHTDSDIYDSPKSNDDMYDYPASHGMKVKTLPNPSMHLNDQDNNPQSAIYANLSNLKAQTLPPNAVANEETTEALYGNIEAIEKHKWSN